LAQKCHQTNKNNTIQFQAVLKFQIGGFNEVFISLLNFMLKLHSISYCQMLMIYMKTGQSLVKAWSKPGQSLVKDWSKPGQSLVKAWSKPGQRLVKDWSKPGQRLVKALAN
jgi:hypothetical protein